MGRSESVFKKRAREQLNRMKTNNTNTSSSSSSLSQSIIQEAHAVPANANPTTNVTHVSTGKGDLVGPQQPSPVLQPQNQPPPPQGLDRAALFFSNIGRGGADTVKSYTTDIVETADSLITGKEFEQRSLQDQTLFGVLAEGVFSGTLDKSFGEVGRRITHEPGRVIGEVATEAAFMVGTMGVGAAAKGVKIGATTAKVLGGVAKGKPGYTVKQGYIPGRRTNYQKFVDKKGAVKKINTKTDEMKVQNPGLRNLWNMGDRIEDKVQGYVRNKVGARNKAKTTVVKLSGGSSDTIDPKLLERQATLRTMITPRPQPELYSRSIADDITNVLNKEIDSKKNILHKFETIGIENKITPTQSIPIHEDIAKYILESTVLQSRQIGDTISRSTKKGADVIKAFDSYGKEHIENVEKLNRVKLLSNSQIAKLRQDVTLKKITADDYNSVMNEQREIRSLIENSQLGSITDWPGFRDHRGKIIDTPNRVTGIDGRSEWGVKGVSNRDALEIGTLRLWLKKGEMPGVRDDVKDMDEVRVIPNPGWFFDENTTKYAPLNAAEKKDIKALLHTLEFDYDNKMVDQINYKNYAKIGEKFDKANPIYGPVTRTHFSRKGKEVNITELATKYPDTATGETLTTQMYRHKFGMVPPKRIVLGEHEYDELTKSDKFIYDIAEFLRINDVPLDNNFHKFTGEDRYFHRYYVEKTGSPIPKDIRQHAIILGMTQKELKDLSFSTQNKFKDKAASDRYNKGIIPKATVDILINNLNKKSEKPISFKYADDINLKKYAKIYKNTKKVIPLHKIASKKRKNPNNYPTYTFPKPTHTPFDGMNIYDGDISRVIKGNIKNSKTMINERPPSIFTSPIYKKRPKDIQTPHELSAFTRVNESYLPQGITFYKMNKLNKSKEQDISNYAKQVNWFYSTLTVPK